MNDMTITRKSSDTGLSDDIQRDAAKGPVVTPGYLVMRLDALAADIDAYEGLLETLRILSNPANADDLRTAIAELDAGQFEEHELADE